MSNGLGKTLEQTISTMPENMNIKVGAKEGNSYFFCGTVGEFKERIDAISDDLYKYFVDYERKNTIALAGIAKRFPKYPDMWRGDLDMTVKSVLDLMPDRISKVETMNTDFLDFCVDIGKWAAQAKEFKNSAKTAKQRVDGFTDLKTREVVDCFVATSAADRYRPLVLIVDGHESGKWWTMEEAVDN